MGGLCGSGLGFAASAVPACAIFGLSAACPALVLAASHALSEPPHSEPRGAAGGNLAALGAAGAALLRALRLPSIYKPLCFFLLQNALVPSPAQAMGSMGRSGERYTSCRPPPPPRRRAGRTCPRASSGSSGSSWRRSTR